MNRVKMTVLGALALAVVALPGVAAAQGNAPAELLAPEMLAPNQVTLSGTMTGPGWVQSYSVSCSGNAKLKVEIRDCCMPGDHFEASARTWDKRRTTVRVLATGNTSVYSGARLRPFGVVSQLRALVNVRYMHGINVFPAGFYVRLTCLPATSILTYSDEGQMCDTAK